MNFYNESIRGVCMATDAGQYNTLSESMNSVSLNSLMSRYYNTMFPAIKAHNGLVSDVIGDAMLALWAKPIADHQLKADACHAALKITKAVQQFNQLPPYQLPTRLGLHYGEIRLDYQAEKDCYEKRAGGEAIHTATGIESLNKILRTNILVSSSVIDGLCGFTLREIGLFLLKNNMQPITVFELVGKSDNIDLKLAPMFFAFGKALQLFQTYQWSKALKAFYNVNKYYPNDGPTIFYINYLQQHLSLVSEYSSHTEKPIINMATMPTYLTPNIQ
jgi:adenylate cyclase